MIWKFPHIYISEYKHSAWTKVNSCTGYIDTFKDLFDWYVQYLNMIITFRLDYQNGTQLYHLFSLIRPLKSKWLKQLHTCMLISTRTLYKLENCGNTLWKKIRDLKKKLIALNLGPNQHTLIFFSKCIMKIHQRQLCTFKKYV